MKQNNVFAGKVALVTGSSQGIGWGIAQRLSDNGATVVLNGRDQGRLEEARRSISNDSRRVEISRFDVTVPEEVDAAIAEVEQSIGPIDILVNNAGGANRAPFLEMTFQAWQQVMTLNLTSVFLVSQTVARRMTVRGSGKIINICSLMSAVVRENNANYAASKGAVAMLTKSMAVELGPYGIQVNGIGPGYVETPLTQSLRDDPDFSTWFLRHTPMRRWANIGEIGDSAVFLASPASDYITGQVLYVDGGFLASM